MGKVYVVFSIIKNRERENKEFPLYKVEKIIYSKKKKKEEFFKE